MKCILKNPHLDEQGDPRVFRDVSRCWEYERGSYL